MSTKEKEDMENTSGKIITIYFKTANPQRDEVPQKYQAIRNYHSLYFLYRGMFAFHYYLEVQIEI